MARLNTARSNTRASTVDSLYRDPTPTANNRPALSPSPAASQSSDKENRAGASSNMDKGKGKQPMAPPQAPAAKRRRLEERGVSVATTEDGRARNEEDLKWYDPNQDPSERRALRQGMRENTRQLRDRHDEFLNDDSASLITLINNQNNLMKQVKQTSDATVDARFLVEASEIAYKRATALAFGDSSAVGVDVDEWISKCISFMKHGRPLGVDDDDAALSTQARRNRRANAGSDDEDEDNDGDALDWHILGARACFPHNRRPGVTGHLLGPLSAQKKIQKRQVRLQKDKVGKATKPQTLEKEDLEAAGENDKNVSNQCAKIKVLVEKVLTDAWRKVDRDANDDMDEEAAMALQNRHGLSSNGQLPFFQFAINPHSFGQTVENFFYISFLVRDGFIKVDHDGDGLPTIIPNDPTSVHDQREKGAARHQAIFTLDFHIWKTLIYALDIKQSTIPHRDDENVGQVNATGWYN
ncbi:Nse4-domain-containing protein [Tothia fuscella]|uniref:Non-structural maintenance of chromosomes element 4 n=1 Tax=Tothia fuscella TaxID=1048955 RepID=A0A9P4NXT9_9PEZI|nr:Nse4-domain-containing protein [Tothia fuscella]